MWPKSCPKSCKIVKDEEFQLAAWRTMKKIGKTGKISKSSKYTLASYFRGDQSHSLAGCTWSWTSKMLLSVYSSKMLVWDIQSLTKLAEVFLQLHVICGIHVRPHGGFCSKCSWRSRFCAFSFANQQRHTCIILLQMNSEPGFKMFSNLTENIHLANN